MTITEFRKSNEYTEGMNKIKGYPEGYEFTIKFIGIPQRKVNALKVLLRDCCDEGILESVSFGLSLEGELVDETYVRTGVK